MDTVHGLCCTCDHGTDCVIGNRNRTPILQCEEFRQSVPAVEFVSAVVPVRQLRPVHGTDPSGLCGDCRHHGACMMEHAAKPIWYCDEYV